MVGKSLISRAQGRIHVVPAGASGPMRSWRRGVYHFAATLSNVPSYFVHRQVQVALDLVLSVIAICLAFNLRFGAHVPVADRKLMLIWIALLPGLRLASFAALKVYKVIWRYFSLTDAVL